jgi:hypothetical protein
LGSSSCDASRGMESVTPVPTAVVETLRDWSAETVQASMSTPEAVPAAAPDCWEGGGTAL